MAINNINVSQPNNGLGDKLRDAFVKVNDNFQEVENQVGVINDDLVKKDYVDTGYKDGLTLIINLDDNSKFDISAGNYVINIDGIVDIISFDGVQGITPQFLTTYNATYIALNEHKQIIQKHERFTNEERRTLAILGAVVHSNKQNINVVNQIKAPVKYSTNQLHDLIRAIGAFNVEGNVYSANGSNLQINKSLGQVFGLGINGENPLNPHQLTIPEQLVLSFRYRLSDGTEYGDTQNVDPNNYEVNGVLTPVNNNKFTIQHINLFQSGISRLQYAQGEYQSLEDAEAAIKTQKFIVEKNIAENSIFRSYLIVKKGTTNLSNPSLAKFIPVDKFGNVIASNTALTYANIIAALGFTPENEVNKVTVVSGISDDNYPTDKAVGDYVSQVEDNLVGYIDSGLSTKVDKVTGKQLSTEDYTTAEKSKLAGIQAGAEVNVNADWNAISGDGVILNKPSKFPPSAHTHPISDIVNLHITLNNKADLVDGLVPSSQLPSYVDDVLEGTKISDSIFNDLNGNPYTPESGKLYVDVIYNKTYRWSGSIYASTNEGIALGETASTAYRGDRGKIAYDHSQTIGNPHGTTKANVGLGNVDNTSDLNKPISTATQNALNTKANDADVVHKTGNETIPGIKTFTSSPIVDREIIGGGSDAGIELKTTNSHWKLGASIGLTADLFNIFNLKTFDSPFNIKGNGNVGIGIIDPQEKLAVEGRIGVVQNDVQKYHFGYTNGGLNFGETGVGDNRLVLKDGGNVGIGTNNPSNKLTVNGDLSLVKTLQLNFEPGGDTSVIAMRSNTPDINSQYFFGFVNNNSTGQLKEQGYAIDKYYAHQFGAYSIVWNGSSFTSTERMILNNQGVMRINNLAGAGTRPVVADANGNLSTVLGSVLVDRGYAPVSKTDTGKKGEMHLTADYLYYCYADNNWRRIAVDNTW